MPSTSTVSAPQGGGSSLCHRCRELKVIDLLLHADILDELTPERYAMGMKFNSTLFRSLGLFGSIVFADSCPVCRLILSIVPAGKDAISPDTECFLRPMRLYNRLGFGWTLDDVDDEVKKQYCTGILFSTTSHLVHSHAQHMGEPREAAVDQVGYSFALSSNNMEAKQQGLPARIRGLLVDPAILKAWLDRCESKHQECRGPWSDELLCTSMVDVVSRTVVKCPSHCRYVALSYVWGGVMPEERALEKGTLPPTIEDAIMVTKSLGIQYLWVDAVCIDQRPSAAKSQQLAMMDLIYSGAYATIVAVDGDDSNAGLRGVCRHNLREPQCREWVDGYELATVYPPSMKEISERDSKHSTRAWTLQEMVFSRRRILFGKTQVHYLCCTMNCAESVDDTIDPVGMTERSENNSEIFNFESALRAQNLAQPLSALQISNSDLRVRATDKYYTFLVGQYTSRSMTNDDDSLNACLGLLNYLQRSLLPGGFFWGLPLREYPQSLRWFHMRWVKPRRRKDFPSWSFVGWEGEAGYTDALVLKGSNQTRFDDEVDIGVELVGVHDKVLTLKGYHVTLEIRNEPFSNAYVPGSDMLVGILQEGGSLHNNTLPTGIFEFIIVERWRYRHSQGENVRHTLFLILQDLAGGIPTRRSMVRLYVDLDFIRSDLYAKLVEWRDDMQLA
ncbi:hypothetical protein QQS21_012190 [Conoideocrella luteorostrata]|uniref:Heterokaryon incompatibility domain-containing protein n=1 Tax=Conoideocrella luteorostrata TaxID=1105319 RepID=A0AAJ0CEE4_9HYPO|nr:hypothetical protein QQS21_012190 [Conoideocrella luteorostrata]